MEVLAGSSLQLLNSLIKSGYPHLPCAVGQGAWGGSVGCTVTLEAIGMFNKWCWVNYLAAAVPAGVPIAASGVSPSKRRHGDLHKPPPGPWGCRWLALEPCFLAFCTNLCNYTKKPGKPGLQTAFF